MNIKINLLTIDDLLLENIVEDFFSINSIEFKYKKNDYFTEYQFKSNENNISFYFREKIKYFRESNLDFFKDTNGLIIIYKKKNFKSLDDIWYNEIEKNKIKNNIPLLFLEINKNNIQKNKNIISNNFYNLFKYISHSKIIKNNKKMINEIFDIFINKLVNLAN